MHSSDLYGNVCTGESPDGDFFRVHAVQRLVLRQLIMYFDNITLVRSRKSDPQTSHEAAKRSERFAESHSARILAALRKASAGFTAAEIGAITTLTVVQVDRRTIELQRKGLIRVRQHKGKDVVCDGMRVWEAV